MFICYEESNTYWEEPESKRVENELKRVENELNREKNYFSTGLVFFGNIIAIGTDYSLCEIVMLSLRQHLCHCL